MSVVGDKVRAMVERMKAERSFVPDHKVRRADYSALPFPSPPQHADPTLRDALSDMAHKEYCLSVLYSKQSMRADKAHVHPIILDFSRLLIRRLRVLNVPMYAHCYWRSEGDQLKAFLAGNSKVRYPNSPHNAGCAVDVVHGIKHWQLTPKQWSIVGHIGLELASQNGWKLVWGGDDPNVSDKFDWDPAHWELADWRKHRDAPWDPITQPELADWRAKDAR